ncbi:MAG: ABC transporter permease subunit [Gammaproteobacteria bacterium]|nr:ABC transporter permease subunit [Gammaproteobacteria bacterium]MDH5629660.1 ABC transporter permease subunit [Gammaproteobacteria bacterium]
MIKIILNQFANLLLSLFGLSLLSFLLSLLFPTDTIYSYQQTNLFEKYWFYLNQIISLEWGTSLIHGRNVFNDFILNLPATIELIFFAFAFAAIIGIPLGVWSAQHKFSYKDKTVLFGSLMGYSLPIYWWASILVLFFSVSLGLTPVAGRIGFEYEIQPVTGFILIDSLISDTPYKIDAFYNALKHLFLPAVVLGTVPMAIFVRITRSAMIDVLSSDFIRAAKSRGLAHHKVLWHHALRNVMLPVLTAMSIQISVLLTGILITEIIFSWPGIGKWLLEAVHRRDYATIHGGILAMSSLVIITNMVIQVVSHYFNPELRFKR